MTNDMHTRPQREPFTFEVLTTRLEVEPRDAVRPGLMRWVAFHNDRPIGFEAPEDATRAQLMNLAKNAYIGVRDGERAVELPLDAQTLAEFELD
jgi:hypothetical protein